MGNVKTDVNGNLKNQQRKSIVNIFPLYKWVELEESGNLYDNSYGALKKINTISFPKALLGIQTFGRKTPKNIEL